MQALPVYTDFNSLAAINAEPGATEREKLESAARQFSAVFTNMLLKSMRQASLGEGILDNEQSEMYRDLFDQQIALQLNQGQSLGIAELLVNQFSSRVSAGPANATSTHVDDAPESRKNTGFPVGRAAADTYEAVQRDSLETQALQRKADINSSSLQDT